MHHPSDQSCCARTVILLHVHTNVCVIQANSSMNNMLDFTEFETYAAASRHNEFGGKCHVDSQRVGTEGMGESPRDHLLFTALSAPTTSARFIS